MWKKAHKPGKRRGGEIYFVLYLAALILLLPGKQDRKTQGPVDAITSLFQQSFSLLPEKNTLLCKMVTDSSGVPVLQLDTSNVLLLTGKVRDVSLECIVEDQDAGEVVKVSSNPGAHFTITYDSVKQLAFFSWHPPSSLLTSLNESKNYAVTVKAKAKPLINGENPELQQLLNASEAGLLTEAKFSISILAEGNINSPSRIVYTPAENNLNRLIEKLQAGNQFKIPDALQNILNSDVNTPLFNPNSNTVNVSMYNQPLILSPKYDKITVKAKQFWSNRIYVQGIFDSKLYDGPPIVNIVQKGDAKVSGNDNEGTVNATIVTGGEINLEGKAPLKGKMTVKLTVKRKSDAKFVSTEFDVEPYEFDDATLPEFMHPDSSYRFNANIDASQGMQVSALLIDENGNIVAASQGRRDIKYSPNSRSANKEFIFVRKINDTPIDSVRIPVTIDPPSFIIKPYDKDKQSMKIIVTSHSFIGDKPNRSVLKFVPGTLANIIEIKEDFPAFERGKSYHKQVFSIKPKDPDEPFSANIYFIDAFGSSSKLKTVGNTDE
ncbi:MAG: hypothetical protein ACKOFB_00945 [bacterium]